jgi:phospholipid transport system transporter-binding protein
MSGAARAPAEAASLRLSTEPSGRILVQGPLTFATARLAAEQGGQAIRSAASAALVVDCAGVSPCDSAGLAVLLEWLGVARALQRTLRYENLPAGVLSLARISDLDELLTRGA